jgi:thioredoxin-like negative regulator of GroEL
LRTKKNNVVEETASRASTDRIQTITASDFDERVLHAQGPVAVEFMSYGCGHCRVIEPVLQKVAESAYSRIKIYRSSH